MTMLWGGKPKVTFLQIQETPIRRLPTEVAAFGKSVWYLTTVLFEAWNLLGAPKQPQMLPRIWG